MKAGLFARPNLKMFVVAAVMIVALDHFLGDAASEEADILLSDQAAAALTDQELDRLIENSLTEPTSENFIRISDCLRLRGETKRAMDYLRKASLAAQFEDQE